MTAAVLCLPPVTGLPVTVTGAVAGAAQCFRACDKCDRQIGNTCGRVRACVREATRARRATRDESIARVICMSHTSHMSQASAFKHLRESGPSQRLSHRPGARHSRARAHGFHPSVPEKKLEEGHLDG